MNLDQRKTSGVTSMPRKTSMPSNRRTDAFTKVSILVTITFVTAYLAIQLYMRTQTNRETIALVIAVPVLVLLIWTAVSLLRIPKPSVPKLPKTDDRHERIILRRLTSRRWERAIVHAHLSVDDRSDLDKTIIQTPRITSVKPVPLGLALTIEAIPGQSPEDIKKRIPNLASALAVPLVFRSLGARTIEATATIRNPLDKIIETSDFPALDLERMSVQFGIQEDGEPAIWQYANQGGGIVGGVPGAGKTVWATLVVGPLLLTPYAQVHIIDGKGGLDWNWAKEKADSFSNESEDFEVVADQIDQLNRFMKDRLKNIPEGQPTNFWRRKPSTDEPFVVLAIDECQTYFDSSGKSKEDKVQIARINAAVENIVKKGRSAGVFILLMTQKPTSESIPTAIRDNAGTRICFHVKARAAETAVLGDMPDTLDEVARAISIPPNRIGGAVMADESGRRVYVRASYLPEETATNLVQGVPA